MEEAFPYIRSNAIKSIQDGGKITVDGCALPGFQEVTGAASGIIISTVDQETIL